MSLWLCISAAAVCLCPVCVEQPRFLGFVVFHKLSPGSRRLTKRVCCSFSVGQPLLPWVIVQAEVFLGRTWPPPHLLPAKLCEQCSCPSPSPPCTWLSPEALLWLCKTKPLPLLLQCHLHIKLSCFLFPSCVTWPPSLPPSNADALHHSFLMMHMFLWCALEKWNLILADLSLNTKFNAF